MPVALCSRLCISIHALREEGDPLSNVRLAALVKFLSTPSARRATRRAGRVGEQQENFYPRPPREGRLAELTDRLISTSISIHALREEGDI